MVREVILPKLGQTMTEGSIVSWLKKEGDPVRRGEVIFELETDKATLDVESPAAGYVRKILIPEGQVVPVLTPVALISRTADEDISTYSPHRTSASDAIAASSESESVVTQPKSREIDGAQPTTERILSSPRARKVAREKQINLALVTGTGPEGRIVERDIDRYLQSMPKATPVARRIADQQGVDLREVTGSGGRGQITKADVERILVEESPPADVLMEVPVSGIRAVISTRMQQSHQTTAPVTLTTEVDATSFVEALKELRTKLFNQLDFKLSYNDLLIKMVVHALGEYPYMNARLKEETIHHIKKVHIGLAVDTSRGLLVPVLPDADDKGLIEIAKEVRGLVERARSGKALPNELSGSTFTITNLGMFEIDAFTPIINMPEGAILGVGCIKARPAAVEGEICIRQMMWLSLTFDHRLVDGGPAARFLQRIKQLVESPYLLLA
jgi:pyruvate dehydrogenase E2 component (dihydrolipoamide acetyltransferase)